MSNSHCPPKILKRILSRKECLTDFITASYNLYIWHLEDQEPDRLLYVAVPRYAYEGIFSMPVGQMTVTRLQMKLIVYAISGEGALQWITP